MLSILQHYKNLLCTAVIMLFISMHSFAQVAITGKWVDANHREKKVEMYIATDSKVYGKNEDGLLVFKSLIFNAATKTYSGILINPDDKEEFSIVIKQPTTDSFTFSVKKFIFSKTFLFVRQTANK